MLSFITGYGNKANSSSAWSSAGADEPPQPHGGSMYVMFNYCPETRARSVRRATSDIEGMWHCHQVLVMCGDEGSTTKMILLLSHMAPCNCVWMPINGRI